MGDNLRLLLADVRQALFDEIKADEGASSATRYEIGRAIGLMGRAAEQIEQRDELLAVCEEFLSKLGPNGYFPNPGAPATERMRRAVARTPEAHSREEGE